MRWLETCALACIHEQLLNPSALTYFSHSEFRFLKALDIFLMVTVIFCLFAFFSLKKSSGNAVEFIQPSEMSERITLAASRASDSPL